MAKKGKAGSMVIICTDGLANIGVGSLDVELEKEEEARKYYNEIIAISKESGVVISTISIKGEEC